MQQKDSLRKPSDATLIETLRSQLDRVDEVLGWQDGHYNITDEWQAIGRIDAIDKLMGWLRKYGDHASNCRYTDAWHAEDMDKACTCGWVKVRDATK